MQPGGRSQAPMAQMHNKILGGINMTITMSYEEYNKMQDFVKQFVAKKGGTRPILEYIKVTVTGNTAKAEALDGYKAGYIMLDLSSGEGDGEILLPVTSKLKRSDVFAVITDMDKEIEIRTATGASIYRKPEGEFFDTSKIYPEDEPAEVFGFDPVLLSDALKAFKGEKAVKIEYRGTLKPLIIKSSTAQALVLPIRLPQ
jgi:DNA polymerase III sliding clamp (beta) subunit (PCNA family)